MATWLPLVYTWVRPISNGQKATQQKKKKKKGGGVSTYKNL
jgi:hypothetical protein